MVFCSYNAFIIKIALRTEEINTINNEHSLMGM